MKKIALLLFVTVITFFACQQEAKHQITPVNTSLQNVLKEKPNPVPTPTEPALEQEIVDTKVKELIREKNDFRWDWVDLHFLWSAIQYGDNSVAIGYKPADMGDITDIIHQIDLKSPEWKSVHDALIDLVVSEVNKTSDQPVKAEDIIIEDDQVLPIITFRLTDVNVITKLYNLQNVRYIEPLDYWPADEDRSTSGCGGSTQSLNTADWSNITPGCRQPWNFTNANIPGAWNTAQGQGITIGVIDAGISSAQSLLGSAFNNGDSNVGRTITTGYTWGNSAYSSCTHGTSMSGIAAGARNNMNASTGVAYKANLHFIRGCEDVVLDKSSERTGVKNALVQMGNNANIRIISMSVGTPFYSSVLYDGVTYAYNQGKMLFAAAGTSFSWTSWWGVVYPAVHSQCNAITGRDESGNTCETCHDGSEVDFTIIMERNANDERTSLSLAPSGTNPTYIGGSSVATATSAGIAALVWSARPTLTRTQVYNCLRNTAQYYPNTNGDWGYGNLNAAAAVAMALTL